MSTGYYPGCSLEGTSREFGESFAAVARALGAGLREIEDWSCCGASSAHVVNHRLAVALPARNLALAEAQGFDDIVAPCAACYNRLAAARQALAGDRTVAAEMADILGRPVSSRTQVRNVLEFLGDLAPAIEPRIVRRLPSLKVACYYGCLLVRPSRVTKFDDPEQPASMEAIARLCGAAPVAWNMAVECCGGSSSICRTGSVIRLGRAILDDARRAGAQAIVVACPMCQSNLDFRQAAMTRGGSDALPVLYITQIVGLALGLSPRDLGLQRHFVNTADLTAALEQPSPQASGAVPTDRRPEQAARTAAQSQPPAQATDAAAKGQRSQQAIATAARDQRSQQAFRPAHSSEAH